MGHPRKVVPAVSANVMQANTGFAWNTTPITTPSTPSVSISAPTSAPVASAPISVKQLYAQRSARTASPRKTERQIVYLAPEWSDTGYLLFPPAPSAPDDPIYLIQLASNVIAGSSRVWKTAANGRKYVVIINWIRRV